MGSSAFLGSAFFGVIAWLYYLCFLLLAGLWLFIAWIGQGQRHRAPLRRLFLALALSLLLWQLTLFIETRTVRPVLWLALGRLNFTAMVFAPFLAWRFVQEMAKSSRIKWEQNRAWRLACRWETVVLAVLTLFTPWVDASERVESAHAVSTFGPLLPVYGTHVLGYWGAALLVAWRQRRQTKQRVVRDQLGLIGSGILITGFISLVTNLLLPYGWGDFRFCDIGPLSVLGFLLCVAYATFLRRLFALGIFLRETLVNGILLAFVLGAYSSAVFVISQTLTASAGQWTQFAVLIIAFSFDPLRRFLEEKTDRLLFGERKEDRGGESGRRRSWRGTNRRTLALLFPWRHP